MVNSTSKSVPIPPAASNVSLSSGVAIQCITKKRQIVSGDEEEEADSFGEEDKDHEVEESSSKNPGASPRTSPSSKKRRKRVVTFGGTDVRVISRPQTETMKSSKLNIDIRDETQSPVQFLQEFMKRSWDIDLDDIRTKISSAATLAAATAASSNKKNGTAHPSSSSCAAEGDGNEAKAVCNSNVDDIFRYHVPTEEQLAGYTTDVVSAARHNNLDELKRIYDLQQKNGLEIQSRPCRIDGISQFGETLLHLACRRGYSDMVTFLIETCDVPTRVVDDFGRNPVHDACWNPVPQLDICQTLIGHDPVLFLQADKRGFTPFEYARPQHWIQWKKFLWENRRCFFLLHHRQPNTSTHQEEQQ